MKGEEGRPTSPRTSKAVEYYKRYLAEDPNAPDKAKVEKAIGVLEAEIKRLKTRGTRVGLGLRLRARARGAPAAAVAGGAEPRRRQGPRPRRHRERAAERDDLPRRQEEGPVRDHAVVRLARRRAQAHHREARLQGRRRRTISADPSKLFVLRAVMSQEDYLGWVEITSNIPGADIFIDDKSQSARSARRRCRRTSSPASTRSGSRPRATTSTSRTIEVIAGETHTVKATLKGTPVGKLNVLGLGIEDATIYVDGKVLCERGPCLKSVPQGDHTIEVTRPGYKPYTRRINDPGEDRDARSRSTLAPEPSRSDAVDRVRPRGGLRRRRHLPRPAGEQAARRPQEGDRRRHRRRPTRTIRASRAARSTRSPPTPRSRLGGITALTAVYYTFRDKGAPSTGLIDVRALALQPADRPQLRRPRHGGHF